MLHCSYRGCEKKVKKVGDLCPTHHQVLLERMQRHLSEEDSQFLIEHIGGCSISEVATHLGISIDTIDKFLTSEFEGLTFGGPGQFLDQRMLIHVLWNQAKLRQLDKELAELRQSEEELARQGDEIEQLQNATEIVAKRAKPAKPSRYGKRAEDELVAHNIARLLNVSDLTVHRWMDKGLLPYEKRPLGDKGRMMKVVKMAELVAFVQSCFGNRRFARYGETFSRFLREQTNKKVIVS